MQELYSATNEAFTEIVFHTNVEAGIRGVIGLLIVLRPGLIKFVLTLRQTRSALAILTLININ